MLACSTLCVTERLDYWIIESLRLMKDWSTGVLTLLVYWDTEVLLY